MIGVTVPRFNPPDVLVTPSGTLSSLALRVFNAWRQALLQQNQPVLFANLPATPVIGMLIAVTDSTTTTWGATIAGGGANTVLAHWNGAHWTVAAI